MRKWIIALAALLVLPAVGAAATIVAGPEPEQLVEGHTVFTVIQVVNRTDERVERFAAAVAVLVREVNAEARAQRFPGVLWFNDQYLVNPDSQVTREIKFRYPCRGAVIATEPTLGDPRAGLLASAIYVESYHITDPNDRQWDVDKWTTTPIVPPATAPVPTPGSYIWTVAIMNRQADYALADDGTSNCAPAEDRSARKDPGANGHFYPTSNRTNAPDLLYNAVLYFHMEDLANSGTPKDHNATDGSSDYWADSSGCHATPGYMAGYTAGSGGQLRQWPCPDDNDDREGNSHPYNPYDPNGPTVNDLLAGRTFAGRGNHGGSAVGCGNPIPAGYTGEYECHRTSAVDIYFGPGRVPVGGRVYPAENEFIGSTAPYHCHDDFTACNMTEYLAANGP